MTNHKAKWPITLMCYTGCRNSELYRITKKDINLETKSIYIDGTKTAAAKRYIPLAKKLEEKGFLEFIKDKDESKPILDGTIPEQQLNPGLTHQCLYFEQPHTFEQILFIQTAEP
ncbi:tyrosine-type recombinase/integrase, partial [Pseudaeromonas pectinilytica]